MQKKHTVLNKVRVHLEFYTEWDVTKWRYKVVDILGGRIGPFPQAW